MTSMSFADAARVCLTAKYATLSGRARRSEYWWFSLLYVSAAVVLVGISFAIKVPLLNVLLLPLIVPMPTVSVRRLHDTGKSGWRMLIALIPVVGPVVYLVGMMADSACRTAPHAGKARCSCPSVARSLPAAPTRRTSARTRAGPGSL